MNPLRHTQVRAARWRGAGSGDQALAGLALLLLPLVLQCPARASSAEVELPAISIKADEESGRAEVRVPGVSVTVNPGEPTPAVEGPAIDLTGTWKFREDLEEKGHLSGWQDPALDDSAWRAIQVPSDWEKQGVVMPNPKWAGIQPHDSYNGYAWYRRHFTVPPKWSGATLRLRFGAIDDWDWTYVNGQLVGTTTGDGTWDDFREYSLVPGIVKPGEDNVIAVRVCDMGGGGGIWEAPVELVNPSLAPPSSPEPQAEPRRYTRTRSEIVRFGADVTVGADEKVEGSVVAIGGDADIRGYVTGDVVVMGGTIHARPGSLIDGDTVVVGGRLHRQEGAVVRGDAVEAVPGITWPRPLFARREFLPWKVAGVVGAILGLLAWGFIALLVVLVLRDRLTVMADALPAHPARAALYGVVGFALTPAAVLTAVVASVFVSVILAITIIGIPLIPAVFAALLALVLGGFILLAAGIVAVWLSLGKAAASLARRPHIHPAWAVLIGVVLIAIASQIPVLGHLVAVTVIIFGFGLAIMTGLGVDPQWAHRRLGLKTAPAVPSGTPTGPPGTPPEAPPRADPTAQAAHETEEEKPSEP